MKIHAVLVACALFFASSVASATVVVTLLGTSGGDPDALRTRKQKVIAGLTGGLSQLANLISPTPSRSNVSMDIEYAFVTRRAVFLLYDLMK